MFRKLVLVLPALMLLTACESFTADRYVVSSSNQAALNTLKSGKSFAVAPFSVATPESVSVACRMAGPIQVAGSGQHEEYIQKAFIDELQAAGVYRANSSKVFSANITSVNVKTISPASWTISGDFLLNDQPLTSVETVFPYKTSYSAMGACNNAAENFPYAVEGFLGAFISSPEFKSAVK